MIVTLPQNYSAFNRAVRIWGEWVVERVHASRDRAAVGRGGVAIATTFLSLLPATSAAAASYTKTIDASVSGQRVIDLAALPPTLPQYEPVPGQTLSRILLSFQGTLTTTTTVTDLPSSPLSGLFALPGTVRLLTPDDTVLLSFSGLTVENRLLNAAALPVTQTLTLGLPPRGVPTEIALDPTDPATQALFQGTSPLPLQLLIEATPSLTAIGNPRAQMETRFTGQLGVTYETQAVPPVIVPPVIESPVIESPVIEPPGPVPPTLEPPVLGPPAPATVPEPGPMTGLLTTLGLVVLGRRTARHWKTASQVR